MEAVYVAYGYCTNCYRPTIRLSTGHEWSFHAGDCEYPQDVVPCETAQEELIIITIMPDFLKPDLN